MENVNKIETYSSKVSEKELKEWDKEIDQAIKDNPIMMERLKNA